MTNIIRSYPKIKDERLYRYSKDSFEKYKEITKSSENYEKLKIGINYKTNRKIQIGGKLYEKLSKYFYIYQSGNPYFLFTTLDGIDETLYLQSTEQLKKEIQNYNTNINNIICKINLLDKWEQYVDFEGKKYGIHCIYNNIHRENNCFGLVKKDYCTSCTCSCCENWGGCGNSKENQYYKCEKCNFQL